MWRFRVKPAAETNFRDLYGPTGEWSKLFSTARGFLGTELRAVSDVPHEYETIDRWESRAAWETFLRERSHAYELLDRECARLTEGETFVDERDE